ncbi:MAG: 16S rRNA (guanine(966)-N(2))-methyltransferase RsmD [Pseudomonadota bacterium]
MSKKPSHSNTLRIIGGQWKGRRLRFPTVPGLRPTPDRVRETLFNWLMFDIPGARCLDGFAGSGALGLEALSRGATHLVFIDTSEKSVQAIKQHLATLACFNADVIHTKADKYLKHQQKPFDIVFLDPPFRKGLLKPVLDALYTLERVKISSKIYIEVEQEFDEQSLPSWLDVIKKKQAGDVSYLLAEVNATDSSMFIKT